MLTTTNAGAILTPAQVDELLVKPVLANSVAMNVAKVIRTSESSLRLPVLNADASAAWTPEGTEIAVSDADITEIDVTFSALKGLSVVSNELVADSNPEASGIVGASLARDIAKKLDAAFFGTTVNNGPAGIGSVSGAQAVATGTAFANLDPFHEAIAKAEEVGASVRAFVTSPAVALSLAKLKTGTGSNTHLLGPDPTSPTNRTLAGVPLYVSQFVEANTVWAVPAERTVIGLRQDVSVETDRSAFFSSDRTAIRAVLRAGFGFPHAEAIIKITVTP
ncbi:phage major capsid protein [Rhodococcus ruber]|uniref:Phage major capsid protein, HK97 family n=2 Tax=Nocardiaceae TaxID=85025 RepID=A0A098BVT6_9NOCA|nr:phage major capsid protein [Rhodococcus ruber]MCD2127729.1 phage major capsid protein [Rhodococcus ruber]CDZ92345.1 Phage major capsid protein, HK97 family [Rhodococcus ruber]